MATADQVPNTDDTIAFEEVDGGTEIASPEVFAGNLLEWAVERHASDLYLSDTETSVIVSVRRMGRIEQVRRFAKSYGKKLQGYLRVAANSDAGDALRPTEGRGKVQTPGGREVEIRLSAVPTLFGLDVAVRLFDSATGNRRLDQLGLDEQELQQITHMLSHRTGLVLISGPVAGGKSSTLYAAIQHLHNGERKIHTLEDPIEHVIDGVMQSQINPKVGLDFADLLSSILRHGPDVIMIGEIRDAATAATAVRAGASGQLVLATIHAKSTADAIDSLLQYDVPTKFVASTVVGVIGQRLARHLCRSCRREVVVDEAIPVSDRVRSQLGDAQPRLWAAVGCDECHQDGFDEQFCLAEIMQVDSELTSVIDSRAPVSVLHQAARDAGMLTLAEKATLRTLRGDMTPEDANGFVMDSDLTELARLSRNAR